MKQTSDGYLWIGTGTGLVRFDGVHFVPWVPPADSRIAHVGVTALTETSDGSLWVGTYPLVRIKDGKVSSFPIKPRPSGIVEDPAGGVWVSFFQTREGQSSLCHYPDPQPRCLWQRDGVPGQPGVNNLFRDRHGALWMGTMSAMVTGNPGSFRSVPLPTTSPQSLYYPIQAFAHADDGTLLVGRAYPDGKSHLDKFSDGHWTSYQVPGLDGSKTEVNVLRRLRDGSLWVGTTGGLYIVRNGQAEHYDVSDGLSGSTVEDIFEDREGDVWLLTDYGLESFRIPKVITFSHASGLSTGSVGPVLAARNGSVYVGLPGGLDEIRGDSIHHLPYANTAFNFLLTEDHTGRLWAGLGTRLGVREGDRFRLIKRADGTSSGVPKGLVEDASGDLWGVGVLPNSFSFAFTMMLSLRFLLEQRTTTWSLLA
jgi:ligand-binding sensor domain-containing protein